MEEIGIQRKNPQPVVNSFIRVAYIVTIAILPVEYKSNPSISYELSLQEGLKSYLND